MSEAFTWVFLDAAGDRLQGEALTGAAFPTRADAEAWLVTHERAAPASGDE